MSVRQVLVVVTTPVDGRRVREAIREGGDGAAVRVHVVAPAVDVSFVDRLTGDEDRERADAQERAETVADSLREEGEVTTALGDSDPIQAIEDALATFPAEELVVVTHPEAEAGWLEEEIAEGEARRFGLPIRHIVSG